LCLLPAQIRQRRGRHHVHLERFFEAGLEFIYRNARAADDPYLRAGMTHLPGRPFTDRSVAHPSQLYSLRSSGRKHRPKELSANSIPSAGWYLGVSSLDGLLRIFGYCERLMIRVKDLSKSFGRFRAVSDVTFDVAPGQVVGLLGANGAGKTTTLRMITGFLPPDSGFVQINGHDTLDDSGPARRCIGYLPESAPAYGEMATEDYLRFRGRLYALRGRRLRDAVAKALALCDLQDVRRRRVGHLSRGYRQRVGFAAAILHEPPVLVLDEPTSALDPRQIRGIRGLIRQLAQERAVLVSSHILPEVEQTCDRVVILARGRILAQGTPAELVAAVRTGGSCVLECRGGATAEELARLLGAIPGVGRVTATVLEGWMRFIVDAQPGARDLREAIGNAATSAGATVRELHLERPGLERVFLELMESAASGEAA